MTYASSGNLVVSRLSPDGAETVLINQKDDARNDFRRMTFRAYARNSVTHGRPPFCGIFRPQGDLMDLQGRQAEGTWTLVVKDEKNQNGGALNQWVLGLTTNAASPSKFHVDVRFLGEFSPNQQHAFYSAANRWSEIITGDVPPVLMEGETIDDILIEAQSVPIDGMGGTLGKAGPQYIRPGSFLPAKGIMSFDTADLNRMEDGGSLEDVILHEMAHVLGFGTLWSRMKLIQGGGSINPTFLGARAMQEYGKLRHKADSDSPNTPKPIPVANKGGKGTRDGHWREVVFGDELLTGFLSGAVRPISGMSIGAFEDMGYLVNLCAADSYVLPNMLHIAELGLFGTRHKADTCGVERIEPIVLPPSAVINSIG